MSVRNILKETPSKCLMGAFLMTILALCTLLTLLNMCLYIYYRKTPEMKATSVGLSMMIYLSCFAIYIGCVIDAHWNINKVADHERRIVCVVIVWPIYLSSDIILAVYTPGENLPNLSHIY